MYGIDYWQNLTWGMMPVENEVTNNAPDGRVKAQKEQSVCLIRPFESLRPGMLCPQCQLAKIDYDGLLNLVCPHCGLTETGAST
jgi:rubredoxin